MSPGRGALACPHCGTPVEPGSDPFCCAGCRAAWEIVRGAGLERYYRERARPAPRPDGDPGRWSDAPLEELGDGSTELRLVVDGLRCASCVWLTEAALLDLEGVERAHVSYATGRARVRFDPARTGPDAVAGRVAALGYRPRRADGDRRPDRSLLTRLGVATFAALNVMMLSAAIYAGWWGSMEPRFDALFRWLILALSTPVALWCASPFFSGALRGLARGRLHMDVPISLAVAVLYVQGAHGTFTGGETWLDSMAMLVALLLGGRVLEAAGRRRAVDAALDLSGRVPAEARRVRGGRVETVAARELVPGDEIDVARGEEIPADGVTLHGAGAVQRALVTGEADPVPVAPGDRVWAGTTLVDGALGVRVEAVAEEALIGRMAAELREAADRPAGWTARPAPAGDGDRASPGAADWSGADRLAPLFTAGTLAAAALTWAGWLVASGPAPALAHAVAVLVVACPCALALSGPLAGAAGLGAAARRGLLVRSPDALAALADVDRLVLDKTGTLTRGTVEVLEGDDALLRVAAGIERYSAHPVARAVLRAASDRGIPLPRAHDVRETPGWGIEGTLDGRRWTLRSGSPGRIRVEEEGRLRGSLALGDRLRAGAREDVALLGSLGVEPEILTGDHRAAAERVAREVGIGRVRAEVRPRAKSRRIRELAESGHRVLFVGDGLNDAPALAAADVGVAVASGVSTSILAADAVLASESLRPLAAGIVAARHARRVVRGNRRRAVAYNVVAVGAAVAGWINPLVAAVLMPLSSVWVILGTTGVERGVRGWERGEPVPAPPGRRTGTAEGAGTDTPETAGSWPGHAEATPRRGPEPEVADVVGTGRAAEAASGTAVGAIGEARA